EAGRLQSSIGAVSGVLSSLGVGLSAGAFLTFVTNINNGVDALNDLKDATGASIENISALEDVAKRTGTSLDTVGSALVKLNQALNGAKPGSDTEKALNAIGLSVKDLKALDPAEAFRRIAVELNKFADDGNKARLSQELFGKSLREVAPLLKDVAESGALVATVTTEQAEAAEKFNKELFALQGNIQKVSRGLVSDLVVGINAAAQAWRDYGAVAGLQTLLTGDDQFKNDKTLVEQTDKLLRLERDVQQLKQSGSALDAALLRRKQEDLKVLKEQINTTLAYRQVLAGGDGGSVAGAAKPSIAGLPAGSNKPAATTQALADQNRELAEQAKLLATLTGVNGDYQEQLTRLQVVRKSQNLSDARYAELVTELIDKQPAVRALYAEQEKSAKAWEDQAKASARAVAELSKDYDAYVKTLDASAASVEKQVQALQDEEAATLIAAQQNISLAQAIEQVTIARLEEAQTKSYANGDQEAGDAIKREIEARKKLATAIGGKEVRDANKKAAEDAAKE
ncbi:MAG: hypothetical protein WBK15_11710, partial [Yoonia sp.]